MIGRIKCPNRIWYFRVLIADESHDSERVLKGRKAIVTAESANDIIKNEIEPIEGCIGCILFKNEANFNCKTIAHVATHCSTIYLRLFNVDKLIFDEIKPNQNEEEFADLVGWFCEEITNSFK